MMLHTARLLASLLVLAAQEPPESVLSKKCDSEIPWITDGTELVDLELEARAPKNWKVDRAALLEEAKKKAAERKRLILWYVPRVAGPHMYRAQLLDQYMKTAIFTDPRIVDLVKAEFVPLRMCVDEEMLPAAGIKKFDFVEPGFIFMTAEGKVLHTLGRIRTFNAEWIRDVFLDVLHPEEGVAMVDRGEESKARCSLRGGHFEEARAILRRAASPEAAYLLAAVDFWTGKDPAPRLKELIKKSPDSPWAWRAASNLAAGHDTLPDGPMMHAFEDYFSEPHFTHLPSSTCLPQKDVETTARRAVSFLLRAQRDDGAWKDARYSYWPDAKILPNVHVAVTTLAAMALREWRAVDPARIDEAVARAEKFILDDGHLAPGKNEECYADAYRLLYLAPRKRIDRMNKIVTRLAAQQRDGGLWAHEYPNPFATAAVVHCLWKAKQGGADVPASMFEKAAEGLKKTRGKGGCQAYEEGRKPASEKDSMARSALCESALWECGQGTLENVASAIDAYWKNLDRLEAIRVCDFHSDGQLGGFFFFHGVFHTCEAALALEEPARKEHLKKFRAQILSLPEIDGSFLDSHELGKSYGTAMALLVLSRSR